MRTGSETAPVASTRATLALARPALGRLLAAALLGAGAIGATVALMATSAWMLSRASQRPGESALGLSIVAVQCFGLSRGFFRYYERLVGHDAALRLLAKLRVRFFGHVETLAPAGLPAFSRGELLARLVGDVDELQELLLRVIPPCVTALLVGAATVAGLWWALPAAGATTLVALLLAAGPVPALTGHLARRAAADESELRGRLTTSVVDLVEGAGELAAYGATGRALEGLAATDAALTTRTRRNASTSGLGLALTTLLAGMAATVSLAFGVAAVHGHALDGLVLGTLAVVPLAAFELVAPLPLAAQSLARARRGAGRYLEVLETPPPVTEPVSPEGVGAGPHVVRLDGVWAAYPTSGAPVLRGVDLVLEPGSLVAVVGRSGAGKSTLAALLCDLLPSDAGAARLDGIPYSRLDGEDVRGVVGLAEQVPHLFDGTLGANLRLARPDASDEALVDALREVRLGEFFDALPDGLATRVGRGGRALSGGQRQRVGLARALLADWPVLVLDEPTEHLDGPTGRVVLARLLARRRDQATLVISHRLEGLEAASEICVLDGGRVVERGTHDALLERAGAYAARWWDERSADVVIRPTGPARTSPRAATAT